MSKAASQMERGGDLGFLADAGAQPQQAPGPGKPAAAADVPPALADTCKPAPSLAEATYRRISRRLLPLFFFVIMFNHIDRSNLGYAALSLNADHGFSAQQYANAGALFFVGFLVFQVPGTLALMRVGTRLGLGVMVIGWGVVATCMAFIRGVPSLYIMRILLGVFEAGAVPGIWHHMSLFYPADRITQPYAMLMVCVMVANVAGAPLAAGLLAMERLGCLRGWQWLFLLEGLPSVLLGLAVLTTLPNAPRLARWLSPAEQQLVEAEVHAKQRACVAPLAAGLAASGQLRAWTLVKTALANPLIHIMGLAGLLAGMAAYTYVLWLPIVINGMLTGTALQGLSVAASGGPKNMGILPILLATIPYATSALTTIVVAASSQRRQETFLHATIPVFVGGTAFLVFAPLTKVSFIGGFVCLVVAVATISAANGVAFSLVGQVGEGPARGIAFPLFTSYCAVGGCAGQMITGVIVTALKDFTYVAVLNGGLLLLTGFLLLWLRWYYPRRARYVATSQHGKASPAASSIDLHDGVSASAGSTQAMLPSSFQASSTQQQVGGSAEGATAHLRPAAQPQPGGGGGMV